MLVLNFSHPLTDDNLQQIEQLAAIKIEDVRAIPVQIVAGEPLEKQIVAIVDKVGFSAQEWQTTGLLINPPGYAIAALALCAELHGRIGHFPSIICMVSRSGPVIKYEVVELLNLQELRDSARQKRG